MDFLWEKIPSFYSSKQLAVRRSLRSRQQAYLPAYVWARTSLLLLDPTTTLLILQSPKSGQRSAVSSQL
ncbi:MAG: hypothetical protein F6J93_39465 [Oscillatoria sp. SIO1A7]|nr:hypothetical protein [Oscillatoria sp. SIO1A7]